ncbi:hypothetical protein [Defluviitalea phaphyphila]|uniref:hypothetical protein n=1 Tax=Defluviitalea phaphyphila TaxID=1473580 RepID=UPI000730D310|nr:hypothetical protein [Defluviitalea phaphyphila]
MLYEISQDEMMKTNGGNDAFDAFIGTIEMAWALPVSIGINPAAGIALAVDGISHIKDACNGGN